jgi:hypothetical protein
VRLFVELSRNTREKPLSSSFYIVGTSFGTKLAATAKKAYIGGVLLD